MLAVIGTYIAVADSVYEWSKANQLMHSRAASNLQCASLHASLTVAGCGVG